MRLGLKAVVLIGAALAAASVLNALRSTPVPIHVPDFSREYRPICKAPSLEFRDEGPDGPEGGSYCMCPSGHRCDGSFCAQSGVLAEVTARYPTPRAPAIDARARPGFPWVAATAAACPPQRARRLGLGCGAALSARTAGWRGPRRRRRRREAGRGRRGCPRCPWRLSRAAPATMGSWRWYVRHRRWALGGGSATPQEPPLGCGAYCSEQGFCVAQASAGLYDCRNPLSPRRMTRNQRKCAVRLPRQGAAAHRLMAGQACNSVALAEAGVVEGIKAALGLDSGDERAGAAALVGEGGCTGFCDHKGQCGPLRDEAVYNCTDARNPQQIGATPPTPPMRRRALPCVPLLP